MNRQEIINSEKNRINQHRLTAEIFAQNNLNKLLSNKEFYELEIQKRKTLLHTPYQHHWHDQEYVRFCLSLFPMSQ